jgi:hypothetical protein
MPYRTWRRMSLLFAVLTRMCLIIADGRVNTRRMVRGRGTDNQGATSNNTNLFHLGTRVRSMPPGPTESAGQYTGKVCCPVYFFLSKG